MKPHVFLLVAGTLITTPVLAATDLVNEDWVLAPKDIHSFSFTLPQPTPLFIQMAGVKNTAKGVTLRVVPAEDFDACSGRGQGQCRSRGEFDGFQVSSFNHTGTVPAGRWTFFVTNSENIINRATVHVHVVANP